MRTFSHFACGTVIAILLAASPADAGKQPWVADDKLEFNLPGLDDQFVDTADERFAGKVILVNLWATWCPPCLSEIPTLTELQETYGDRGLVVVAIAFEQGEPASRRKFLRSFSAEQGIDYLVLDGGPPEDLDKALPAMRNVRGLPVEILIDRAGRVVEARNGYGFKKKWAARLKRRIEELLEAPSE